MSRVYAVTITEVVTRKAVIYVAAPDKDNAWDVGQDFAQSTDLEHRYIKTGREVGAYLSDVNEVSGPASRWT